MKNFLLLLLCIEAFGCNCVSSARTARPRTATWNPDNTQPSFNDVAAAAAHARATRCNTPSCKAIIVIHELVVIARYEDGDANGLASLNTGNRPRIAGRRLDRVLLRHRELYGPVCSMGRKLISRFGLVSGLHEMYVPVQLLVNAVDMDLRNQSHCAADLLAALPKRPVNDEVRQDAEALCVNDYEDHHRPRSACDILTRGLNPGQ